MREVEVKVLHIDKIDIEKKLVKIGAKLVKKEKQINIRFDNANHDIKKNYGGYMRVRETEDLITGKIVNTMTLKKNISKDNVRINEEKEVIISNLEETIDIFEALGYKRKKPGKKNRTSYIFEDLLFEIDEWEKRIYPHPYMEIEGPSKERIFYAIELLGIDKNNVTSQSLDDLVKDL